MWVKFVKSYRWTLLIWSLTFFVILPYLAQSWVFSPFFLETVDYKSRAPKIVDTLNMERFLFSEAYLSNLNPSENLNLHSQRNSKTEMAAIVITKKRKINCTPKHYLNLDCEPHYLQQVLVSLDKETKSYAEMTPDNSIVPIIICNVEPNWREFRDLEMAKDLFPTIHRYNRGNESDEEEVVQDDLSSTGKRRQESSDYAFCLEAILNHTVTKSISPKYILVLEDDAAPFPNFFQNVYYALENRVENKIAQGERVSGVEWSFLKLYYPEVWQGFGTDGKSAQEMVTIAILGALAGMFYRILVYNRRANTFMQMLISSTLCGSYLFFVSYIISRQVLLELRRVHPFYQKVTEAPGCCTPAVVYPTQNLPLLIEYLRSSFCEKCSSGVDLAIDEFIDLSGLVRYMVEPNLVEHIGMHSTLTNTKNAFHFLFYKLLYG